MSRSPVDPQARVLDALRRQSALTAVELSQQLGGGAVAMRVHLRTLVAAGLITHEAERRPVGRPVRRYKLTAQADSHFPKQYEAFAVALADAVATQLGAPALERVLDGWLDVLVPKLKAELPERPDARLEVLARHQSKYGFMATVEKEAEGRVLVERNCPIAAVAVRYPSICDYEAELFRRVTGHRVKLVCCQAKGDQVCKFLLERKSRAA